MKRWVGMLLAILLVGGAVGLQPRAAAQTSVDPMFFFHGDALWRWTEADGFVEVGPLPEAQLHAFAPATSAYLVYQVLTDRAAADAAQGVGGGTLPTNLWLMDTTTGATVLIAGQPADVTTSGVGVARGAPQWSPDGALLAWTEGVDESALVIYDVAAGTSAIVREGIPSQTLVGTPARIEAWTQTGILFENVEFDADYRPQAAGYTFYGADGRLISELPPLPVVENDYDIIQTADGHEAFLFAGADATWLTMDTLTGAVRPAAGGVMTRVALGAAATSLRVDPPTMMDKTDEMQWDVYAPDGTRLTSLVGNYPLLSPSGRQVLYVYDGPTLSIWRSDADGGPYTIELPWHTSALTIWGITAYRLERGGAQVIVGTRCAGSGLPFRLRTGFPSAVLGSDPNNVRDLPGLESEIIGQIPGGAPFDVLEGPHCAAGLAWWYVQAGDLRGWTAEGQGDTYWLAPGPNPGGAVG